jgi:hypothetical protein
MSHKNVLAHHSHTKMRGRREREAAKPKYCEKATTVLGIL